MATLFKRGTIYWTQVYHKGKRRRISLGTGNHGVARAKVRKLEYELETRGLQLETTTPLEEILPKFIEYLTARGGPDRKGPRTDIYRLAEFFGPVGSLTGSAARAGRGARRPRRGKAAGKRKAKRYDCAAKIDFLEEVTTGTVLDFLVRLQRRRGLSTKTLNEYREILQRLFNWAIRTQEVRMPGEARRNPVADVERFRTEDNPIRFLSIEQIHEQLDALRDHGRLQALVATYIYAGLRREEAFWLTHEDVDFAHGLIHVRAKIVAGGTWRPKTRKNRVVPISKALRHHLRSHRPRRSVPWYFASPKGCRYDPDNFSQNLAKVNRAAGLPWSCLDYRHTFGSQLAMKGESLYKISKIMGNSPEICRRHYAALTPESLIASVDFDETPVGPTEPGKVPGPPTLRLVS